ncbi:MAG: c-type cytochrome [Hyphomicrobiaceae bacterium]|nr:c-type cytochrome [Hyphomicrobiaceae bacterium]
MARRRSGRRRTIEAALAVALIGQTASAGALDAARTRELADLVRQDCGSCHGMTLKGGLGRALTPERLRDATTDGLARIILDGVPGTPMPPWSGLITEEEAMWIAESLRNGFPP